MSAESSLRIERMKIAYNDMIKSANDFNRSLNEYKDIRVRQMDIVQRDHEARTHAEVDEGHNMNQMAGVEIANTKKVSVINICFLNFEQILVMHCFQLNFSALIAIARHWPNVHYVGVRHIAQPFARGKIGTRIKSNVPETRVKIHNRLCYS